jgi:hypothetical protein
VPARGIYQPPESLPVTVNGKQYDVLAFHPADARELLSAGGFPNGKRPVGAMDGRIRLSRNLRSQIDGPDFAATVAAES